MNHLAKMTKFEILFRKKILDKTTEREDPQRDYLITQLSRFFRGWVGLFHETVREGRDDL